MLRMANDLLPATAFKSPAIALSGIVDYEMHTKFRTQFDNASEKNEGFQNLVLGSSVTLDQVLERAPSNWYLEAQEAKSLGLVEAVL